MPNRLDTASVPRLLSQVPERGDSYKILVVDDTRENRALAQAALEDEGYAVRLASHGAEGLEMFAQHRPDCVLLDVRMPGMDGFAVCERIRQLDKSQGQHTPIVFLTALRDVDTFDRALRAGADDFLIKPIRPTELTVRIQTALKLGRMNAELLEQYAVIRKQRDDLMRLQLQKDRLASFIVHDLKNPAGAVDLHAQLILRDASLAPRSRESALRIREEVRHLVRLVMNLLDISRSEQGELVLQPQQIDLEALLREVLTTFEVRARNAEIQLQHALEGQSLSADRELLQRVLENLIDNALRHSPERGAIQVSSRVVAGHTEIRVRDFGPGVPVELREKVFEPYIQLEHGERALTRSGRGLGLTFCRVAVLAHGGTIWIEDAAPGAAFCFKLPHLSHSPRLATQG